MATTTPGRRTFIGAIGAGMAMLAFTALSSQPAGAADNPTAFSTNLSCSDLGFDGVKIDAQPENGTYSGSDLVVEENASVEGTVPTDLEIEISGVVATSTMVTFDWHATTDDGDFPIDAVLVKFANGGLRWDYAQPGESSDTAWATQDSISHVSFCFDAETGGTTDTGTTDTGTTDTGTTDTGDVLGTTSGGTDTGTTGNEVLGNTVTRPAAEADTLPATGSEDMSLAIAGSALIGLGAAGLATSSWLRRSKGAHMA